MDKHSQDYFYVRAAVPALHQQSIRNEVDALTSEVGNLIDRVFAHLPAIFSGTMPEAFPKRTGGDQDPIPSLAWLAWNFYHQGHYCDVELRKDSQGSKVAVDQLIHDLCTFTAEGNRNQLFFLQGSIGSGKTAFVNHLITKHGLRMFKQKRTWFLRLNIDVDRYRGPDPIRHLFVELCAKLTRVIQKISLGGYIRDVTDKMESHIVLTRAVERLQEALNDSDKDAPRLAFFYAVKEFSSLTGRRLLLILDNLDWYFHENDRFLFMSDVDTGENPFLATVNNVVREFYHGSSLSGDLGANILFVLRHDSYVTLRESRVLFPGSDGPFPDNLRMYALSAPDWSAVLEQRTKLVNKAVEAIKIEGLRNSVGAALNPVVQALHSQMGTQRLITHLQAIVPFGLRSVMEFLKQYTWLNREDGAEVINPAQRYLEHYPVGLMCFMLRGYRLFSQLGSRFPNLYFTNVGPDDEQYTKVELQANTEDARPVNVAHPHTYWLKHLLLSFIQRCNEIGEVVKTRDVVDVFCSEEESRDDHFDSGLVRLCLGSFAQTHISNLIEPVRQISSDERRVVIGNIELTVRAKHCLGNVFNRFYYLQLIVDDYMLPIPRLFEEDFRLDHTRHYGYLVRAGADYSDGLRQMVSKKAVQVVKFVAVLAESWDCEKEKYAPVFERLRRRNVDLPDPATIIAGLWRELEALEKSKHVPTTFDLAALKTNYIEWREELRPILRAAYRV